MKLTAIDDAVAVFVNGGFVALLDEPDREGEADLLLGAEHATGPRINRMITIARGLLTVAITGRRLEELDIQRLQPRYHGDNVPAFTEPVDYSPETTTGISAYERAATIQALIDPGARAEDFVRPGHVFPLAACPGGLCERAGHTEGAITLAQFAEMYPAVVMCEIMAPDGHMARGETLASFAADEQIPVVSTEQLLDRLDDE